MLKLILVVDDEKTLADMLVMLLQDAEQEGIAFYDGQSALDYIKNTDNEVSMCVVDVGLPDIDGLIFSKELHKIEPNIPVIIMTGALEGQIDSSGTHIVAVFQKPIDNSELIALIKKHTK